MFVLTDFVDQIHHEKEEGILKALSDAGVDWTRARWRRYAPSTSKSEDAVFKVLFLAIQNAKTRWRANKNWNRVLSQLDIFFEGRLPT